jgi:hypothetical protein
MDQGIEAARAATNNIATMKYGAYQQPGNHAGKTVAQIRTELSAIWNVPGDAQAFKGKTQMADDYVVQPGDSIEFHRRMGEKG